MPSRPGSWIGSLADRTTQLWVRLTGREITLASHPWLAGPIGRPEGIGAGYFEELARTEGLVIEGDSRPHGLLASVESLAGAGFDAARVHPLVRAFYERTSEFEMTVWAEWRGIFRPFGWLLARLFSRRLEQLNLPLSALDPSRGMSSRVLHLTDPRTGELRHVGWVRTLLSSGQVVYAGHYGVASPPGLSRPVLKVVFPLPNGNAQVFLRPEVDSAGSLAIWSKGVSFGDPGFYFTVHHPDGRIWARYLRSMQEVIVVSAGAQDDVRADHTLWLWGVTFLRLHYHLRRGPGARTWPSSGGAGAAS